ncbi:14146_t:CDS:2 [Acaulospora colombiana]|uniref:14146_t:CDS:1 n=1 Tax=Acaulospora colombiana TaxID=27376 RepID=A0ACA9L866_9GLOM|nr:14146_t:CDS:2 [Acaulospora colombiana]
MERENLGGTTDYLGVSKCMLVYYAPQCGQGGPVAWPNGEENRSSTIDYCGASTCVCWVYYAPRCGRGGPVAWPDREENRGDTTDYWPVAWPDGEENRGGTTDYRGASTCAYWVYYAPQCGRGGPVAWSDREENRGGITDYRGASTCALWCTMPLDMVEEDQLHGPIGRRTVAGQICGPIGCIMPLEAVEGSAFTFTL